MLGQHDEVKIRTVCFARADHAEYIGKSRPQVGDDYGCARAVAPAGDKAFSEVKYDCVNTDLMRLKWLHERGR
jgi:hypothetical protein